jgi:integrase
MNTQENETQIVVARRRRKIKVRSYRDPDRPNLKFVVGYREAGKRARKFFETKDEAASFAAFKNKEREQNGVEYAEFPTWLRVMAQEAVEQLEPFNKTIRDAAEHYVAFLKATARSCSAEQLVDELLKAKKADGVGQRHLGDLESRLKFFRCHFDGQMVGTITTREIDAFLRDLPVAPMTRNHYRAILVQAFNFGVVNGYATENPALKAAKAKVIGESPGILSVSETARILEVTAPEVLPYLAIGLFAGLRRAEIERLDWSEIDFESNLIEVKAEKSKTATRRFVTLQPNLRAWLLPHRKLKGAVTPTENFRALFEAARIAAGLRKWQGNALRHSFASYHLAHFKNAAETALQLGHHDSRVTFAHYRELVKPKDAERYWKIKPAGRSRKIVQMAAAR